MAFKMKNPFKKDKETFTKYDEQGLMPHYLINGMKAYKINEIINFVRDE